MALGMKAIGLKINNMEMVSKSGLMEHLMRAYISQERSMDTANSPGLMEVLLQENSLTTTFTEVESMSGLMEESSMASGRITKWKAMVHSHGQMVEDM
jgi:hypothetical protein